ncbi:cupin domain-containing protein [Paenibacillus assamensis]|uniref:cupin domain-containing protein n=1 Tax=Paenibacillus assamensis TaxID=311244 RepID=UPI00040C28A0|nr:cupin domain-containing protein [Paenibacillus assamensis]
MKSHFNLEELAKELQEGTPYIEFLRVPSMSAGIYHLKKTDTDKQTPHTEDEIYYVIEGKARMFVGDDDFEVMQGSTIFVEKNVEHKFHSIEEDLMILVLFSPAEYSNRE